MTSSFTANLIYYSPLLLAAIVALFFLDRDRNPPSSAPPPDDLDSGNQVDYTDPIYDDELAAYEPIESPTAEPVVFPPAPTTEDAEDSPSEAESEGEGLLPAEPTDTDAATAGPAQTRAAPRTRNIGPKKARSIARRDQRRAYHEFHRSQAAARAEADATALEEAQEIAYENARRRAIVEEEINERREAERKARREREAREEREVREEVLGLARRHGRVTLRDGWEVILRREGMVGVIEGGEAVGVVTRGGEWVRVERRALEGLWGTLEGKGVEGWGWGDMAEDLGRRVEGKGKPVAV